ncbi:hypothetical protein BKA64DRAFT_68736 [Cadophora sp. MPI-SDFR-AT-0126]|nr:hypothetical protein BKA64DRAFT_68736 [Leotiomycetes sp. MPI-SDFR-AT-0126]
MASKLVAFAWASVNEAAARANRVWHGSHQSFVAFNAIIIFYSLFGNRLDLVYNIAIFAFLSRSALYSYLLWAFPSGLFICISIIVALAGFLVLPLRETPTTAWKGPERPYLIPCRTTHSRLVPVKHSFSYSYLTVGIPVGQKGSVNGMISVDEHSYSPLGTKFPLGELFACSWFSIRASDHLQRGHEELDLRQKLDLYLDSEGLDPKDFPHAYLITVPRFAGYSFNPVSFWYLYSKTRTLSAMILEVNNTYDERRPYIVLRDSSADTGTSTARARIEGSRVKDFYVSPFNFRKGDYSVLSSDPLEPGMDRFRGIDVKITLNSSKGHPKLVARLISTGPAINPATLGAFSKLEFLAKWFWIGFATVPRIVKEAVLLLYQRKLHVKDKPEPLIGTLGRRPTSVEKLLESRFRQYLEFLVHSSRRPVSVKYSTSGFLSGIGVTFTSQQGEDSQDYEQLDLRVLTPDFYSRFIQYSVSLDGIISELREHRTVWINTPELLSGIFSPLAFTRREPLSATISDTMFSTLIRKLRRRPPNACSDSASVHLPRTLQPLENIKNIGVSSMDEYFMAFADKGVRRRYKWAIIRQLIADRYLMGRMEILNQGIVAARLGIALACASWLRQTPVDVVVLGGHA